MKARVLVVDDHPANRLAYEVILEKDYDVRLAASGLEALAWVSIEDYAVILLDIRMPGLDGFETATLIRRVRRAEETPILYTSASDPADVEIQAGAQAGGSDYLFSPVNPAYLLFKVESCRRTRRQVESLSARVRQLEDIIAQGLSTTFVQPSSRASKCR